MICRSKVERLCTLLTKNEFVSESQWDMSELIKNSRLSLVHLPDWFSWEFWVRFFFLLFFSQLTQKGIYFFTMKYYQKEGHFLGCLPFIDQKG